MVCSRSLDRAQRVKILRGCVVWDLYVSRNQNLSKPENWDAKPKAFFIKRRSGSNKTWIHYFHYFLRVKIIWVCRRIKSWCVTRETQDLQAMNPGCVTRKIWVCRGRKSWCVIREYRICKPWFLGVWLSKSESIVGERPGGCLGRYRTCKPWTLGLWLGNSEYVEREILVCD